MPRGENLSDGPAGLSETAGPVRRWLAAYFRRRVRNDVDVDDLIQDVFARLVARDSAAPVQHLAGYLASTAASVLADQMRRRTARRFDDHVPFEPERHGEADFDPERLLTGREDLDAAAAALLALPERTRTVFLLRRLEGYKHQDIGTHLGISVSAVEKHMARAVAHLTLEMEKRRDP